MRLVRIFTMSAFVAMAGSAVLPAPEAQAAPVAAARLAEQVTPAQPQTQKTWWRRRHYYYYHRRHYWHRHW